MKLAIASPPSLHVVLRLLRILLPTPDIAFRGQHDLLKQLPRSRWRLTLSLARPSAHSASHNNTQELLAIRSPGCRASGSGPITLASPDPLINNDCRIRPILQHFRKSAFHQVAPATSRSVIL